MGSSLVPFRVWWSRLFFWALTILAGGPAPGETIHGGTYQIRSQRTGLVLQSSAKAAAPVASSQGQLPNGPADNTVLTNEYMLQDNQKWTITTVSGGFCKILNAGDGNALEAGDGTADMAPFTGADNQLWKVDPSGDGGYSIASKSNKLALTTRLVQLKSANGIALQDFKGDATQRWIIDTP